MSSRKQLATLAAIIVVVSAGTAKAGEARTAKPVGLMASHGSVWVDHVPATPSTTIFAGDTITTQEGSAAVMQFHPGMTVALTGDGELVLPRDATLDICMDLPANAGACTGNLSCAYLDTLCWRSPTQPLPMDWNPRTVFEKLFGDSGSTDRVARAKRIEQHKSILDSVTEKLASIKQELGPQDQVKVNEYTDAVRDVERRIQMAEKQSNIELPALEQPLGAPPVFEDHLALMMDLKVLAFQSDLTRVISFMISKEQSPRPYPQIGVPEAHHPLSHHNNIPELIAKMSKINTYHAKLFSQYLDKLKATPDGDGSLLDHITILYGAGISNSNGHSGDNLPLMLVGGSSGKIKGGRHLKFANKPSQANLLMTIMDKMGYPVEKVGGSNGKLPIDTLPEV